MESASSKAEAAVLYVVATPIGNPEDITLRALRVLGEVDWVAAEDTRQTRRMMRHHGLDAPLVSYHEHNEQQRTGELIRRLEKGSAGAVVSNAGTPTVSDPGYRLVTAAVQAGIQVVPVPGVTAAAAALSASGLPTDAFVFVGFAPKKPTALKKALEPLRAEERTIIFYESPLRVVSLLRRAEAAFGDRPAVLAREMTKPYEEFIRGRLTEIRRILETRDAVKGECTLLIAGAEKAFEPSEASLTEAIVRALESGSSVSEAAKAVAALYRVPKAKIYQMALEIRKSGQ